MDNTSDLSFNGVPDTDLHNLLIVSFENSALPKLICGLEGKIIANSTFCNLLGITKEVANKLTLNELTHPSDIALNQHFLTQLIQGVQDTASFEKRYIHTNGNVICAKDHIYLQRDSNGNPQFYIIEIFDLSEQKKSEEHIRSKTALLEAQVNASIDGIVIVDEDQNRVLQNKRILEIFKIPQYILEDDNDAAQLQYVTGLTKYPQQFLDKVLYLYNHVTETSRDEIELKNGMILDRYSAPVKDSNGKYLGRIWIFRDITEQKVAEKALIESEERFRNVLQDVSSIAVQGYLPDGTTIYWNKASENLYGYTKQEAIGKNLLDLIIPADMKEMVSGAIQYMAETGIPIPASELALKKKDGFLVDVFSSHTLIKLPGREQELYCLDIDISERIKAEKKLKENQRFIELITEQSPDIIYVFDVASNRNIYINKNIREMLNYTLGAVPEDTFELFNQVMHPDDFKNFTGYDELVKNWDTEYIHSYEYRLKDAYGQWRWFLGREKEFERDNKKIKRLIGLVTEITDRKKTELELIKAKEKAEESDRLKTAFLQNMSHEIRTPMNAIMGFSQLIKSQYNNQIKLEKYADIINQRCNDLLDIINDILDIAKIESGQLPINIEACNLNTLFLELTAFFEEYKKRIKKDHIQFKLQALCLPSNAIIATDKVKLKQILINLISNSFKFTEKGSIEGGCKLDAHGNVLFYVKDTGIGISAEKHNDIFERFTQLNSTKSQAISGTGLGLSIVKGLVELLGGKIWLKSVPGEGSTFSFTLPFDTYNTELQTTNTVNEPTIHYFTGQTLLIVEDDEFNAEYLKEILEHTGMKIYHAQSGEEAIQLANTAKPDFILMDVRLPKMNGYEAAQQIKLQHPTIKIIAQTAYASPEERIKAAAAGCIGYLSKPLHKNELLALLGK